MKICNTCGELKSLNEFSPTKAKCKHCTNLGNKDKRLMMRMEDPFTQSSLDRAKMLWYKFRLRPEDFDRILEIQGGRCAICPSTNSGERDWHVDHDHSCCPGRRSCGRCIRGLLCHGCNTALGLLKDNVEILESAIRYLHG